MNQNNLKSNRTESHIRIVGGFLLKWQLIWSTGPTKIMKDIEGQSRSFKAALKSLFYFDSHSLAGPTSSLWKPKQEEDRNMLRIMSLLRQSKGKV